MLQFSKVTLKVVLIALYLALVMASKKKLKYSLVMEYSPDEDQLEYLEERIDEIDNQVRKIQVDRLTLEDLMEFLEDNKDNIAIA